MKLFVENFLSSKPAEFYWRRINKLPDKCLEEIEDNAEYNLHWKFLFGLFMNKLYLTKMEIIYDLSQYNIISYENFIYSKDVFIYRYNDI